MRRSNPGRNSSPSVVWYESTEILDMIRSSVTWIAVLAALAGLAALPGADTGIGETWRFENVDQIGGHPTTILGRPRVIDTPEGKAIEFNGKDDALFVDVHPLAGAETFTWEVVFRPDLGGAPEQRFFHLQSKDVKTGEDTAYRLLFEIRVIDGRWCLDSFALAGGQWRSLLN